MPNNESDVTVREINLGAEIKKAYGPKWNEPEVAYEWSNGRKHYLRTADAGIYDAAGGAPRELEDGSQLLNEDSDERLIE